MLDVAVFIINPVILLIMVIVLKLLNGELEIHHMKDWLALVDGYCYVGRQRSWTWIKLDSARSAVPGSTRSANASVAYAYIY